MDVGKKNILYIFYILYIFFLTVLVFNSAYYSILHGMALYKSINVIK